MRQELDKMVGLDRVKQEFNNLISEAKYAEAAHEYNFDIPENEQNRTMHLVFTGPPGTGKTSAGRLLAKAYHAIGLVKKPDLLEISGRDLVNPYEGGTATQVKEIFDQARGGVLFVDEAYSMVNGPQDTPGLEALNQFLKLAEDRRDDTVVILAGYGDEPGSEDVVKYLSQFNSGMTSRFPRRIPFDSYNAQELNQIGLRAVNSSSYKLSDDNAKRAFKKATKIAGGNPENPLNARGVRSLVEAIVGAHQARLFSTSKKPARDEMFKLTAEDVQAGLDRLAV